ncbi:class I SAM-dependent methyltransferase, partial [Candidatus Uhrbacteria bacterium]|nr:class I SAM-dependent methyltransferase [Candidatus Uhrbacteria bacterium]
MPALTGSFFYQPKEKRIVEGGRPQVAIVMERDVTRHFSRIAPKYTTVRTTDIQPVLLIKEKLKLVTEITAASLGSGSGRYDLILLQHLKERLRLLCVDSNKEMLKQLITYLTTHGAKQFKAIHADVQQMPFYNKSLDCMFAFNSVHLFPIRAFLIEASRVLKRGG